MEYIANPIKVKALKILEVLPFTEAKKLFGVDEGAFYLLEDGERFVADRGMLARYNATEGDYVVTQEDGYVYLNPKDVFERKYRPAGGKVTFAADREITSFLSDVSNRVVQRAEQMEMAVVIVGTYGGNFYVESTESGIEALGIMDVGKKTMLDAIVTGTFTK